MPPAMRRCCHACSTRLVRTKSSPVSVEMALTTPRAAMMPSRDAAHTPLFRHAKMVSPGRTIDRVLRPAMTCCMRRLGRRIWKKWSGYHRRSLVETKMRCFKLLGERVMARDFDRQVAELQARCHPQSLHSTRHPDDGGH